MRRYLLQAGFLLTLVFVFNLATMVASPRTEVDGQPEQSTAEIRPDGATRLTIPPTGASDQNPAFSPNGKQIVFTRFGTGYNAGPAGLFLLNLQRGIITCLTPSEDQDNVNLPGSAWNPANNRIVFASDRLEADDLWRIAPDGTDFTRILIHTGLASDIEPSWSPDGSWIVFEADQPGDSDDGIVGKIWKVRADGTDLSALTFDRAFDDRQPNWSPVGDRIVFQRRALPNGQWDLFTLSPDGTGFQNITSNPASDTDASWSPDGKWIVYSTDYGGLHIPNIFLIPAAGGQPVAITTSAIHEDGAPSWSPDGTWIAFESHPGQDEDTPASLWAQTVPLGIMNAAKTNLPLMVTAIN
ncbi:MAG: hypothetical protein ACE5DO_03415 [Desulfobacterales bacterium]